MSNYPVGTVIASNTDVWIKKEAYKDTPGHEIWWINAVTYAVPVYDERVIDVLVNSGEYKVLREGFGKAVD